MDNLKGSQHAQNAGKFECIFGNDGATCPLSSCT